MDKTVDETVPSKTLLDLLKDGEKVTPYEWFERFRKDEAFAVQGYLRSLPIFAQEIKTLYDTGFVCTLYDFDENDDVLRVRYRKTERE